MEVAGYDTPKAQSPALEHYWTIAVYKQEVKACKHDDGYN